MDEDRRDLPTDVTDPSQDSSGVDTNESLISQAHGDGGEDEGSDEVRDPVEEFKHAIDQLQDLGIAFVHERLKDGEPTGVKAAIIPFTEKLDMLRYQLSNPNEKVFAVLHNLTKEGRFMIITSAGEVLSMDYHPTHKASSGSDTLVLMTPEDRTKAVMHILGVVGSAIANGESDSVIVDIRNALASLESIDDEGALRILGVDFAYSGKEEIEMGAGTRADILITLLKKAMDSTAIIETRAKSDRLNTVYSEATTEYHEHIRRETVKRGADILRESITSM